MRSSSNYRYYWRVDRVHWGGATVVVITSQTPHPVRRYVGGTLLQWIAVEL
jgi:hypothetical protein